MYAFAFLFLSFEYLVKHTQGGSNEFGIKTNATAASDDITATTAHGIPARCDRLMRSFAARFSLPDLADECGVHDFIIARKVLCGQKL